MQKKILFILFLTSYAWADWIPPIGIPNPDWGIDTTHWMFSGETYDYVDDGGVLTYRESPDGPYTHYIKPSDGSSTDSGNPYGTEATPRKTLDMVEMRTVPAGTVYQIWGPYDIPNQLVMNIDGTAEAPVFIIGKEGYEPTWIDDHIAIDCNYLIIEGIDFQFGDPGESKILNLGYSGNTISHIAVRRCEFSEGLYADGPRIAITIANSTGSADTVSNVVIYDNWFHNINDDRDGDPDDGQGISCEVYSSNVWIVDNLFHHLGGDGVMVSHDLRSSQGAGKPHHIYIGRNTFHDNYENAVDLKKCEDIIISQNIAYNFGPEGSDMPAVGSYPFRQGSGSSQAGNAAGGRQRTWTIFNLVYNSTSQEGAFLCYSYSGLTEPVGTEEYFIGNVIYDCHNTAGDAVVFQYYGQEKMYYVNNTVYDVDVFGRLVVVDNDDEDEFAYIVNNIGSESWTTYNDWGWWLFWSKEDDEPNPSFQYLTVNNNLFYRAAGAGNLTVYHENPGSTVVDTQYTLAEFEAAWPDITADNLEDNPDFVNAGNNQFQLLEESPAVDTGFDAETDVYDVFFALYGIDIKVDFDGNARTEEWDIGAFQYQSGEPPGPPDYHDHYVYVDPDASGNNDGGRDAGDPNDPTDEDNWTDAYESMFEAEGGEDGTDLPALNRRLIFCCRNSGGSADTTHFGFGGTTTDVTRYIIWEAYTGDRHSGIYDTDHYHVTGTDEASGLCDLRDNYVQVRGIQFGVSVTADNGNRGLILFNQVSGGSEITIADCIFKGVSVAGAGYCNGLEINDGDITNVYIYNCIFEGFISGGDSDFFGLKQIDSSNTHFWNCTFNNNYLGVRRYDGTTAITNCLFFENTDDVMGTLTVTYSALDDVQAGTGNFQITQTADDYAALVVDADGGDYDVTDASSELWGAGTDDPGGAAQGDPDIAGVVRETPWDIGAYEGPVDAPPGNPYFPLLQAIINQ